MAQARPARRPKATPTGRITLRAAHRQDLPVLFHHRIQMWRDIGGRSDRAIAGHMPRYRAWLTENLRRGHILGIVAEVDGRVAGSGCLWFQPAQPRPGIPTDREAYILSMYTHPSLRGRGIASCIVRALLREARSRGMKRVMLHASLQGRSVYTRLGFERTWEMRAWLDPQEARRRARAVRTAMARERARRRRRARPAPRLA